MTVGAARSTPAPTTPSARPKRPATTDRRGRHARDRPESDVKRTFREGSDEWLAALLKQKSRSHEQYKIRLNIYVLPRFTDVSIIKITKSHVMRWRDDLATRLAPNTVNGIIMCLSSAYSFFIERGR